MDNKYEALKLDNQICFPLYAAAREVVKAYNPYLSKIDLTYTQYVTMMVLWEEKSISSKKLGERLHLDSGTLTPVLKNLEKKEYLTRIRNKDDERILDVNITEKGEELRDIAIEIPYKVAECISLEEDEAKLLYSLLYKLLENNK